MEDIMIKNKIPLGTRVEFTAISESVWHRPDEEWDYRTRRNQNRREVVKRKCFGPGGIVTEGMICGVRVLQEGRIKQDTADFETGYQDPPYWCATRHVDVYLVAINYARLVRVQPEDILIQEAK
jgi:hypothetical protein